MRFLILYGLVGLAAGLLIHQFWPSTTATPRPVVEIRESAPPSETSTANIELPSVRTMGVVSYADAVKIAAPAVVNIHTAKVVTERVHPLAQDPLFEFFFGNVAPRKRLQTSLGSGVILSPQGYILTNHHVVADADEIKLSLNDGRNVNASVVGSDPETDLAVLKIDLPDLPAITVGNSENIEVGDVVLAIGNPFGVGQTVTSGIISATGRNRVGINTFENFIQTDAAINPGNSGGALITAYGELIGINTAIFSKSGGSQGIGFAIPVNLARQVMTEIIETGQVKRGWLGIETQDLTPAIAESFGVKDTHGVLVAGVLRRGPADLAGIDPGDIILQIGGKPIKDSFDTLEIIAQHKPGDQVEVSGIRKNQTFRVKATLIQRPVRATR